MRTKIKCCLAVATVSCFGFVSAFPTIENKINSEAVLKAKQDPSKAVSIVEQMIESGKYTAAQIVSVVNAMLVALPEVQNLRLDLLSTLRADEANAGEYLKEVTELPGGNFAVVIDPLDAAGIVSEVDSTAPGISSESQTQTYTSQSQVETVSVATVIPAVTQ